MLKKIFLILIGAGFFSISISTNAAPAPLFYNINTLSSTTGSSGGTSSGAMWGGYSQEGDDSSPAVTTTHGSETEKMIALGLMGAAVIGGVAAIKVHHHSSGDNGGAVTTTVKCWGDNAACQLGANTTTSKQPFPVNVMGSGGSGLLSGVKQIIGGYEHTCALLDAGNVKCWGANTHGQLGNNKVVPPSLYVSPVDVVGIGGSGLLSEVKQIAAGNNHTCALLNDDKVVCWGYNFYGQLGDNTKITRRYPDYVKAAGGIGTLTGVVQIVAGGNHTCALLNTNEVVCWGRNDRGQLGDNTTTEREYPNYVKAAGGMGALGGIEQIAAGDNHTCAITNTNNPGEVVCWGDNFYGQLGDDQTTALPVKLPVFVVKASGETDALAGVAQITAGGNHTCARLNNSQVKCWGDNADGQLGDNSIDVKDYPVDVVAGQGGGKLSDVAQISAEFRHTCALLNNGQVKCWGYNFFGQLGDGTSGVVNNKNYPVDVLGLGGVGTLSGVIQTFIGNHGNHTCVIVKG